MCNDNNSGDNDTVSLNTNTLALSNCLPVWRDWERRLATGPVVKRSSPASAATDIVRYALLANQPKKVESTFVSWLLVSQFI